MDEAPLLVDTTSTHKPATSVDGDAEETFPSVPVTVITGYLGSGKSTLLRHITAANTNKRIAIILNEFGATADVERSLQVAEDSSEVEEWLELDNGCMCCTAKDAGVAAIEKLMQRRGRFDYVLLETSGLADPAPIANMFWLDEPLMASLRLDGVVTVVDAGNILRSLDEGTTAALQLAGADTVIVNKCDTVSADQLVNVKSRIAMINGACKVIESSFGHVDPLNILDLDAYRNVSTLPEASPPHHSHDDISTMVVPLSPAGNVLSDADLARIESRLQHLLWEKDVDGNRVDVYRAKGRLVTRDRTLVVQSVREIYEFSTMDPEPGRSSKLVLIGRGLDAVLTQLPEYFQ